MRTRLILCLAAILAAALILPANAGAALKANWDYGAKEVKLKFFGFSQLKARTGEAYAVRDDKEDDGLRFTAQRIRLGTKYYYGNCCPDGGGKSGF